MPENAMTKDEFMVAMIKLDIDYTWAYEYISKKILGDREKKARAEQKALEKKAAKAAFDSWKKEKPEEYQAFLKKVATDMDKDENA